MTTEYTKLGTDQATTGPEDQKQDITIEVTDGRAELAIMVTYTDGEDRLATAKLTRAELWEHVHNCLDALTRLPKDEEAEKKDFERKLAAMGADEQKGFQYKLGETGGFTLEEPIRPSKPEHAPKEEAK